ncbi:helix-turn-helix domain-containing protein [Pyxidicoccus xibeiensis]|uniref:helix-turn-helix domain-containing protein n=1 Tax=Pyxidicoccus xibeiensis TaxID=2906759 RepID=UPI0020A803F1|nr:helix-turn-helix transcriptional regulator [Pyxidicoccus xibeiensis]MCP3138256.1 helix-turn-helix transcriptional regulator [Pyxidicoccus xibeiensis]
MTSEVIAPMSRGRIMPGMDSSASRSPRPAAAAAHVGELLREWRATRRLSQLDLALTAGLSARHLSCVETGKAQPSRELIARLADALEVPLRERNALLVAAGYAPKYPETGLGTPQLAQVRRAIEATLAHQEPYPAFLLNRHWDVLMANGAAARVNRFLLGGRASAHGNMLRQLFDPKDLRPALANWEEVAGDLIRHLHNAVAAAPTDDTARALLDEVLAYPGVPTRWRTRELGATSSPLLTTVFRRDGRELRFFSTLTTFGTPRDVTIDELHIECCFPEDEATAETCQQLAREDAGEASGARRV